MSVLSAAGGSEALRGLQERAARAMPAEHVEALGGWWLRHAPGCAWWVGTVLPHGGAGPGELVRGVAGAERFYADRGAVARFQITPGACPAGLDAFLGERGYRRESSISLQVASAGHVLGEGPRGSLRVRVDAHPTRAWLGLWHAVHGGDLRSERSLLERVKQPSAYVSAMREDEVLAVGRAVLDTGWAGVFDMATLPGARGGGLARDVLAALASWAGARGADRMYLQVERENSSARRLYERMGFGEVRPYHYRTAG